MNSRPPSAGRCTDVDTLDDGIPLGGASQPIGGKKRRVRASRAPPVVRPWKIAKGDNHRALVESTGTSVQRHEVQTKARARARRDADDRNHVGRIEAVVCNLAHAVLLPPPTRRIATKRDARATTARCSRRALRLDCPRAGAWQRPRRQS